MNKLIEWMYSQPVFGILIGANILTIVVGGVIDKPLLVAMGILSLVLLVMGDDRRGRRKV